MSGVGVSIQTVWAVAVVVVVVVAARLFLHNNNGSGRVSGASSMCFDSLAML